MTPTDVPLLAVPSETQRFVLAFDPGFTTGVAVARLHPTEFIPVLLREVGWHERLGDLMVLFSQFEGMVETVVCEDFALYPSKAKEQIRSRFPSVQVIGNLQMLCELFSLPLVMQSPSVKAHALLLPEHRALLKKAKSEHVNDAYKHLRYWFSTEWLK